MSYFLHNSFQSIHWFGENPFGNAPIDLSNTVLSLEQKIWLGKQIVEGVAGTKCLNTNYNINVRSLQRYAKAVKQNSELHVPGRPRALDREARLALKIIREDPNHDVWTNCGEGNECNFKLLGTFVNIEYQATFSRKRPIEFMGELENNELRIIPKRTRKRYQKLFLANEIPTS